MLTILRHMPVDPITDIFRSSNPLQVAHLLILSAMHQDPNSRFKRTSVLVRPLRRTTFGSYPDRQTSTRVFPCKRAQKSPDHLGLGTIFLFFGYLFAAFALAHRARCAAAIFFLAATDIVRLLGIATTFLLPFDLAFAQRAF